MIHSDSSLLYPIKEGECIYCKTSSERLTDEHVIPVGLGGTRTLKDASCEKCRRVTHKFETTALRHVLGPGRYWLGIGARKPRNRPKTWPAYKGTESGQVIKVEIPIKDLPFFMCLPTYKINPAIAGSVPAEHTPSSQDGFVLVSEDPAIIAERLGEYGADSFSFRVDHVEFSRMLAKIALGYCVSEFGYGCFTPIANPLIIGATNCYTNIVSSSHKQYDVDLDSIPLERRYEHSLMHKIAKDTGTICIRIDLFKNLDAPSYYVMAAVRNRGGPGILYWSNNSVFELL